MPCVWKVASKRDGTMRQSINVSCGRAIKELVLTRKEIFSADDVATALMKVGRGSKSSKSDYMGSAGYLAERGFIERVRGGWALREPLRNSIIIVEVTPGNDRLLGEVSNAIGDALNGFKGVVEMRMEV